MFMDNLYINAFVIQSDSFSPKNRYSNTRWTSEIEEISEVHPIYLNLISGHLTSGTKI